MSNKPFLLDEWQLSAWAYDYCKYIKNDSEIRECITNSFYASVYCIYIKDDPKVRKYITDNVNLRFYFGSKGYK